MSIADLITGTDWVTDGGLETDLIFNRGIDLPEFAAFPLVGTTEGIAALTTYYRDYLDIARAAEAGVILETPTWRASQDWAERLGISTGSLRQLQHQSVALVKQVLEGHDSGPTLVSGSIGPRGDGYLASIATSDEAAEYHAPQASALAEGGADLVHAMTMTGAAEGIGVVQAARAAGLPVAVSFTVETTGRLPDGSMLSEAVAAVEAAAPADWYGMNCAHPQHLLNALNDSGDWQQRIRFLRPNASTLSHTELDAMEILDTGDLDLLIRSTADVRARVPSIAVLGGCCGTDSSHIAALWGVPGHLSS